jgi:hypothetical protein
MIDFLHCPAMRHARTKEANAGQHNNDGGTHLSPRRRKRLDPRDATDAANLSPVLIELTHLLARSAAREAAQR